MYSCFNPLTDCWMRKKFWLNLLSGIQDYMHNCLRLVLLGFDLLILSNTLVCLTCTMHTAWILLRHVTPVSDCGLKYYSNQSFAYISAKYINAFLSMYTVQYIKYTNQISKFNWKNIFYGFKRTAERMSNNSSIHNDTI